MSDRIQYDGDLDHLDEIVLTGVTLHLEQMNTHDWDLQAHLPDGRSVHLYASDVGWVDSPDNSLPYVERPAVPVCHEWETRDGRRHECFARHSPLATSAYHKCSCGCRTLVKP